MRNIRSDRERVYADCAKSLQASGTGPLELLRDSAVVVTGASGFVGSWLLTMLAYLNDIHGFKVRLSAIARRPELAADRASHLGSRDDISWISGDVRELAVLPERAEWLIHAAGVPDSRHHATSPIDTAAVIAEGTLRVLRLAEQSARLQNILHFSSGLVSDLTRHGSAYGPTAAYIDAKKFSETLCFAFRTQAKLPIVITRPFTFLGPFHDLESPWAANNFLHAAIQGQPLKIRGDGRAVRSYLYGSDMAMVALAQLAGGRSGEAFDLGGAEAIAVADLAALVSGQARRPLEIRVQATTRAPTDDRLVADMKPSLQRLGVTPAFSTAEAVERSLSWYGR